MTLEFRLLGNVEVVTGGRRIDIGPARQRSVTAVLLVDVNRAVSVDQLAERVWGEQPPQRYREVLYSYVSRLRRALAAAGDVTISRGRDGYAISIDPAAVDLHLFSALAARARTAHDDLHALELFDQALALWRGEAFGALDSAWLAMVRAGLDGQRLAAELDRNDLRLRCGQHHGLAADLPPQLAKYPLNERLTGQLMLALYRSGQVAEALDAGRRLRQRLVDELGVDPGRDLQRLELAILRNEHAAEVPPAQPRQIAAQTAPAVFAGPVPQLVPEPESAGRLSTTGRPASFAFLLVLLALIGIAVGDRWTGHDAQQVQRVQVGNAVPWPAYLRTVPRFPCADRECVVIGSDIRESDYLVVFCYTGGDPVTEYKYRADNTGETSWEVIRSAGWYGALANGEVGYISEVYLLGEYRGGLRLPLCPATKPLSQR